MTLSLNEVEATAKKAARGAGYPWGLAEEAAKATRWLCAHDLDGCGALAALLARVEATDSAQWRPVPGDEWSAPGGLLCPIGLGAALSDRADLLPDETRLGPTLAPLLLAPFAASIAAVREATVTLAIDGATLCATADSLSLTGTVPTDASGVTLTLSGTLTAAQPRTHRAAPDPAAWTQLLTFAHRTYAPATEESRLKGAGAGLSDND